MKKLFITLCLVLAVQPVTVFGQRRALPIRRTIQPSPTLYTITGTDDAIGVAQTPLGYAMPLYLGCPAQSHVGLYGQSLVNVSFVLIWHNGGVVAVPASGSRYPFPGMEIITFRLPVNVTGEVWVTTAGRQPSNTVRLIVE